MYTVQYERSQSTDVSSIQWVARDSDTLGWDVEDRSSTPTRCIEVKGRHDSVPAFFVSENQIEKAREIGASFEIQFWGDIDLNRPAPVEYAILRSAGYPTTIVDLDAQLKSGKWVLTPVRWRVTQA